MARKGVSYADLGASSRKEDVHGAIKELDKGLFPSAFCKIVPDVLTRDPSRCIVFHADGAGTKSIIAYTWWKEHGDPRVFAGIAQDALVMNIDDIACTGLVQDMVISNTIGRNKFLVPGEVIKALIDGYQAFVDRMASLGLHMHLCGGETADVGDIVRTVIVDSTVMAAGPRDRVIETNAITPGDVVVGLSSTGKASYESAENSGISSNGITLARHVLMSGDYARRYPEIVDPGIDPSIAYRGSRHLDDPLPGSSLSVGEALLSPTRTYVPVLARLYQEFEDGPTMKSAIHAIIHDTGGGQAKCLNFGENVHVIKDQLFPVPPVFAAIQADGNVAWDEMHRVFNMGHRMEVYCPPSVVDLVIASAKAFSVDARVVGHVEQGDGKNRVSITTNTGSWTFS